MSTVGKWMSTELRDLRDVEFQVGDKAVRARISGRAANIEIVEITRIENGKLYVENSKVAINFPGRLLIVTELFK